MSRLPHVACAMLLATLCACRGRPAAMTPSTIPVEEGKYTVLGEAEGNAWGFAILFFPIGTRQAPLARDRAIESVPGANALIDVTCDWKMYSLIVMTMTRTQVRGKAIVTSE